MQYKVNPHTLRKGVIRDWDSKCREFDLNDSCIGRINGANFKNLNVTSNVRVFGYNSSDVERIVKTMKKR